MRGWFSWRAGLLLPATVALASLGRAGEQKPDEPPIPQSTEELKQAIATVLEETKTPGAGVVLVAKDRVLWTAGIGLADRASGKEVTPETMFRAGSISKSFVALALLKLQEEGKLRLDDRVRDWAGDVEFENPWEDAEPLRVVHLLEHTSGFDDISLREYAASVPASDHRESLAFDPRPRKSRWRPGQFFSYSNAGYALAGHIVERVSGQPFDSYLGDEILAPLDIKTASYLLTDAVRENLAAGYDSDGVTAMPYEHMLGRSSGALSTTPGELAHLVQMLLNRGTYRGVRLLKPESIERMETPATGLAAPKGLSAGYGLANYMTSYKGFRFHGHGGAVSNFMALYGYAPDHGVGYVLMINAGNRGTLKQIEKLIMAYLTRDQTAPPRAAVTLREEQLQAFDGYYEPHTPRVEGFRYVLRLLDIKHVAAEDGVLRVRGLAGEPLSLLAAGENGLFRREEDATATLAFVEEEGEHYAVSGMSGLGNYRRVPTWLVAVQGVAVVFCLAMTLSALLFPLVWVPRKLLGRMRGVRHLSVRLLPALAVFWHGAVFGVGLAGGASNPIERFGNPTAWSVGVCALTWLFAATTVAGLVQVLRARRWEVNRWVWWHAFLVSVANVVVLCYLGYWGVIGLRTWA